MGTPIKKGVTTIQWGSGSVLGTPSGSIVESITLTPKNGKPIEIDDNDGFAATLVVLQDGFDAEVTCLYDTSKVYPKDGDAVNLTVPTITGAATQTAYACTCTGFPGWTVTRKKEAVIKFHLTYRPGVSS